MSEPIDEKTSRERDDEVERALDRALERLPRHTAPDALMRSLRARHLPLPPAASPSAASPKPRSRWLPAALAACALVAAGALGWTLAREKREARAREEAQLVAEAVNDHLRIVYGTHPLDVESGGIHQVKPWFTGKLDFAPIVAFAGDDDFPLQGGAIAVFVDRKAAAFVFKRRLHTISLFVFPASGLVFPETALVTLGHVRAFETTTRGFHVVVYREGELGYALVSDVAPADLEALVRRLAP